MTYKKIGLNLAILSVLSTPVLSSQDQTSTQSSSTQGSSVFDTIPDEVKMLIIQFVISRQPTRDAAQNMNNLSQVNRNLRGLSGDDILWKNIYDNLLHTLGKDEDFFKANSPTFSRLITSDNNKYQSIIKNLPEIRKEIYESNNVYNEQDSQEQFEKKLQSICSSALMGSKDAQKYIVTSLAKGENGLEENLSMSINYAAEWNQFSTLKDLFKASPDICSKEKLARSLARRKIERAEKKAKQN